VKSNGYKRIFNGFDEMVKSKYNSERNKYEFGTVSLKLLSEEQISAVLMYTSHDAICSDLRYSMLTGNLCRWRVFAYTLNNALHSLQAVSFGDCPSKLFHGLNAVHFDPNTQLTKNKLFRYKTFMSTSCNSSVAREKFACRFGVVFEITGFDHGVEMHWLTVHQHEEEWLVGLTTHPWRVTDIKEEYGLQIICIEPVSISVVNSSGDMCKDLEWGYETI